VQIAILPKPEIDILSDLEHIQSVYLENKIFETA
jgi:hypothetical protein